MSHVGPGWSTDVAHALLRAVSRLISTPALLFDTVCESCARTGRRERESGSTKVLDGFMLLNPEAGDYVSGCTRMARFPDQPLTLFDAVAATMSTRLEIPVWTYDRHFDLMGVRRWRSTG